MNETIYNRAQAFASQNQLTLVEPLGSGVHGMVFVAENNFNSGKSALKIHRFAEPYLRERQIYERLKAARVSKILGFHVPQLFRAEDTWQVIEMSIVTRPFVLDFAGAYLDWPPAFPEEQWQEWEAGKREQFEDRWPMVLKIMAALEDLDIFMVDVSPTNIAFPD